MEPLPFPEMEEQGSGRKVSVVGSELVENYTVYIIDVTDGQHRWTIKHRYSDFHELHEKLAAERKVERRLLPPKKILGKNSRSLVERRQKELQLYLQTLLLQFPESTPAPLNAFLHFHLYEINGITGALAEELFHKGEQLLQDGQVFSLRPLQLYSVSQQLRLAKPTCCNGDAKTDLGHILDFTCRLRYLKISGTRGPVGTSNIEERSLPFDLSVFKSLLQIEISDCSSQQIRGLSCLRSSLVTMSVHRSTDTMMSILVPEASEFSQWEPQGAEPEGAESVCPVTAVIPLWRNLTTLDMSHNCISSIDQSVKLIPKVEFLDLSYNQLSSVENLQHLYNLVHLDLSYNSLKVLESAHTRLGNIKTLSLAGNQLDQLGGLGKLYSLVDLDLSHNQLEQLEEIRNIGSLPCLEKLNLSSNPMVIIPDYRTKVLAQFGDRASEVCLDCRATTEKELDTVEVLKAIQKAKEVKDRMSSGERKISEDTRPSAAPHLSSSTSSSNSSTAAAAASSSSSSSSSSHPAQQAPSQEVKSRVVAAPPPATVTTSTPPAQEEQPAVSLQEPGPAGSPTRASTSVCSVCSSSSSDPPVPLRCSSCSSCSSWCPLVSSRLSSLSSNQDFITQLSQRLGPAPWEGRKRREEEEEEEEEKEKELREDRSHLEDTEVDSPSSGSRDGYFEMGLDDSVEEPLGSAPTSPPVAMETAVPPEEDEEQEEVRVSRVLWCCCVRVDRDQDRDQNQNQDQLQTRVGCLVLTERLLGLLHLPPGFTWTNQDAGGPDPDQHPDPDQRPGPALEPLLSSLQLDFLVPYSQVVPGTRAELPDSLLSLGTRTGPTGTGPTRWYLFSQNQEIQETRTRLEELMQNQEVPSETRSSPGPPGPPPSLLHPWELEESRGVGGAHPALLRSPGPPALLFLTPRHLWVLQLDLRVLAEEESSPDAPPPPQSWGRLVRVPLGSVVLHPRVGGPCPDPQHPHRRGQTLQLLLGGRRRLLLLFPLAGGAASFLGELSLRRASLEGPRVLALPPPCCCRGDGRPRPSGSWEENQPPPHLLPGLEENQPPPHLLQGLEENQPPPHLLQGLEENQPPPHLLQGLPPALRLLAGIRGKQLLKYFHKYVALSEQEQLRQVLWLSVVLYKSPETELSCCLLLSSDAIYFLLEEPASSDLHPGLDLGDLGDPGDPGDPRDPGDSSPCLCCCLSIRLSELLAVNVGLFDQYFRIVGSSPDLIVCCLSRDGYGTAVFLQELMAALGSHQQLPAPEPSDQDFYSQFPHGGSGKMQNYELIHSSRVKFVYPSDEEMGDLTFIVAERRTSGAANMAASAANMAASPANMVASAANMAASAAGSFNILLYLLVFQVQTPGPPGSRSGPSPTRPVLEPRTLILTGTDIFLLDEDYVSYPLPDFAKEPPSRERYRLREARRIRDLDRVLLGYQTYPQALTLVFDELGGPDLLCRLTLDHFGASAAAAEAQAGGGASCSPPGGGASRSPGGGDRDEVQWCVFVPGADSRERLISLLARQWEALCSRELPVELTG